MLQLMTRPLTTHRVWLAAAIVAGVTAATMSPASAATIVAEWTFGDDDQGTSSGTLNPNASDARVTADPMSFGSGISSHIFANRPNSAVHVRAEGFLQDDPDDLDEPTFADAKGADDFFQFDVTASNFGPLEQLTLDQLSFQFRPDGQNSPNEMDYQWQFQVNDGGLQNLGAAGVEQMADDFASTLQVSFPGSTVLSPGDTIELRAYAWGAESNRIRIDNVKLDGTFEVIPEPASLALLGVGGLMLVGRRPGRKA